MFNPTKLNHPNPILTNRKTRIRESFNDTKKSHHNHSDTDLTTVKAKILRPARFELAHLAIPGILCLSVLHLNLAP